MNVSIRFYLFADDGVFRISQQLMMRLIHDRDAMPKYSGTKQKAVDVIIKLENGKPARIARADGSYLTFDEKGHIHGSLIAFGSAAMETYDALDKELKNPPGKVVEIGATLNREKWERENRWTLSKTDLDLIADDIWRRKRIATIKIQRAKGIEPKPPQITFEAKEAMRDLQDHVMRIGIKVEMQTEVTLKGLAFEARRRSKDDFDDPVWRGVAEAADRRRGILVRHRTAAAADRTRKKPQR